MAVREADGVTTTAGLLRATLAATTLSPATPSATITLDWHAQSDHSEALYASQRASLSKETRAASRATPAGDPRYAQGPKSLAEVDLTPAGRVTPSPEHWEDRSFYFVMPDRFEDGDPSNNRAGWAGFDPKDREKAHGGDQPGLIERLDYIQGMGFDTLWVTPVMQNYGEYQGYAGINFLGVDPRLGKAEDFRALVDAAHARGMAVILDVVTNHSADVLAYPSGSTGFHDQPVSGTVLDPKVPAIRPYELNAIENFHRQGPVRNWYDPKQMRNGDFPKDDGVHLSESGLSDFNTEDPALAHNFAKILSYWIAKFDVDGFRIDTVKHVNQEYWDTLIPQVRDYAESIGKKSFLMMPEIFDGTHAEQARYTEARPNGATRFNSPLNHPFYFGLEKVYRGAASTSMLGDLLRSQVAAFRDANIVGNFIDNHDLPRFLATVGGDVKALESALVVLFTMPGVPIVYYGTEQGFSGGRDPANREDMFANPGLRYPSVPHPGQSHFDPKSALYGFVRRLASLREEIPALRRGTTEVRWERWNEAGLFAFARKLENDEVITVVNPTNERLGARDLRLDPRVYRPGDVLVDRLQAGREITVTGTVAQPHLELDLDGYGAMLLTRKA